MKQNQINDGRRLSQQDLQQAVMQIIEQSQRNFNQSNIQQQDNKLALLNNNNQELRVEPDISQARAQQEQAKNIVDMLMRLVKPSSGTQDIVLKKEHENNAGSERISKNGSQGAIKPEELQIEVKQELNVNQRKSEELVGQGIPNLDSKAPEKFEQSQSGMQQMIASDQTPDDHQKISLSSKKCGCFGGSSKKKQNLERADQEKQMHNLKPQDVILQEQQKVVLDNVRVNMQSNTMEQQVNSGLPQEQNTNVNSQIKQSVPQTKTASNSGGFFSCFKKKVSEVAENVIDVVQEKVLNDAQQLIKTIATSLKDQIGSSGVLISDDVPNQSIKIANVERNELHSIKLDSNGKPVIKTINLSNALNLGELVKNLGDEHFDNANEGDLNQILGGVADNNTNNNQNQLEVIGQNNGDQPLHTVNDEVIN